MSQSYTVLPYINPPAGAYDALNAVSSLNNNFTVSQTFAGGIVDSGSLSVAGTSTFTGVCTFASIPVFSAGINVAIAEVDTGTLSVAGSTTLSGGCAVSGAVLSSSAGLTVSAGASAVQALTATSIVDSGSLSAVGISSSSGLTVSSGASNVQALTCTSLNCSSAVDTGTLSCTTLTCSSVVDAGALSCTALTCSGITDTGALACNSITSATLGTFNGGLNITGSIVYNTSFNPITPVTNDVAIVLGGTTDGNFIVAPSANVNTVTISGAAVGGDFSLLISPTAAITWRKAMSAGTVTIYSSLAGNQAMASGSKWLVRGKCVSATVVYLDFQNFT